MEGQQFEWDDAKAAKVFRERGIDFNDMIKIFFGPRFDVSSNQKGEKRTVAVGMFNDRLFAVPFTKRGDVVRIITARRARKNEEREYYAHYPSDGQQGQD